MVVGGSGQGLRKGDPLGGGGIIIVGGSWSWRGLSGVCNGQELMGRLF